MFYLCNNIERWAYCKRSYKSHIKLNNKHKIIFSKINHNHNKDDKRKLNRQQFCNNLKRTSFEKTGNIIHNELSN